MYTTSSSFSSVSSNGPVMPNKFSKSPKKRSRLCASPSENLVFLRTQSHVGDRVSTCESYSSLQC